MTTVRPGSPLEKMPRFLGWFAVAVMTALSLSTNSATRFYQWPWFLYWQVLLLIPGALLAGVLWLRPGTRPRFGGWIDGGLALLIVASLSSALFSPFRAQSLNAALTPVAAACLAWLELDWLAGDPTRCEQRARSLARLLGALMALVVAISFGLWLFGRVGPGWIHGGSLLDLLAVRNDQPFGHSTYTAGFAVLAAPWLTALGLISRRGERTLWLAFAALAAAVVLTTSSRGGVLGLLAALAGAATLRWHRSALRPGRLLLVMLGLVLAASTFVALNPRLREFVVTRRWSDIAGESNRQRIAMLEAGWLMGRDRVFTGFGPGTVSLVYPRYRARLSGGVDDVLQLHNTPAQLWAEFGLPGVIAAVLLLVGIVRRARGCWRPATPAEPPVAPLCHHLARAVTVTLVGYAVMSLTDYQLDIPLFAAVAATLLALLQACILAPGGEGGSGFGSRSVRRWLGAGLLAALVVMVWSTVPNARARWLFAEAATAREEGRPDVFVAGAERAASTAPWDVFYPVQLGAFYGEQFLRDSDPAAQARAGRKCADLLQRALAINPDQEYCHFNLGWLWLREAEPGRAEDHFRAAARLVPDKGGVYLGLGLSRLARNDPTAAARAFALEWLNDPAAIASPQWDAPPLAGLRGEVAAALHRQAAGWLTEAGLADETRRQLRYVEALVDWWLGAAPDLATIERTGSPTQRWFFEQLPAIERRAYTLPASRPPHPWEQCYVAWRDGTAPEGADDAPFAAAVGRHLARHRDSFARALASPPGDEPALARIVRHQRIGYNVLLRNQDGFLLSDLYIFPENRLMPAYASFLFPAKGYLPGWLVLGSLDRLTSAPR